MKLLHLKDEIIVEMLHCFYGIIHPRIIKFIF